MALFKGAGGGLLGEHLVGIETICAVEIDPYCIATVIQRQNDKILPIFPIWDDIRTFDGRRWRGIASVVSGGFPCQGISAAGKGRGLDDERSGLWKEMFRVIREIGPEIVWLENSPLLTRRGIERVLRDLASMGYDAIWGVLGADDVGAPHIRKRIWILAYSMRERSGNQSESVGVQGRVSSSDWREIIRQDHRTVCSSRFNSTSSNVADSNSFRKQQPQGCEQEIRRRISDSSQEISNAESIIGIGIGTEPCRESGRSSDGSWWSVEPELGRVAHGVAYRMDRLRAIGNGQVPAVVRLA
ncbi:DNA cytosine methyltransferase [Leptospira stimsonii]|uniref:DNA cytosine methyltransferase n=1 Tax=Leptospira stimsonii TaxID=2202203 RepID=UPI001FEE443F|nr:DNA cytosine methyltransferase [Leptospira stimsonii]